METREGIFPINPTFITRLRKSNYEGNGEDTDQYDLNNNGITIDLVTEILRYFEKLKLQDAASYYCKIYNDIDENLNDIRKLAGIN